MDRMAVDLSEDHEPVVMLLNAKALCQDMIFLAKRFYYRSCITAKSSCYSRQQIGKDYVKMDHQEREKQTSREEMMLEGSLPKVITKMAVPSIISFLITSIYNLADTYFVSDLGESAQAAISVNASLDQIIMMAGSMLAVGAASYISRLLGAKDKEKADQVLSTAFFMAAMFGAVVTVLGVTFMHPMVRRLGGYRNL